MMYIQKTNDKLQRMICRQKNPLENDSVRLDDNSVLVGQQKAREKTLFLDDEGRTTTTPIPRLTSLYSVHFLDRNALIVDGNLSASNGGYMDGCLHF